MDRRVLIGGYEYMAEVNRGVLALNEAHSALTRIVEERPGLGVIISLVARAALKLNTMRDALENLREIGHIEAERRKRQKTKNLNTSGQGSVEALDE